MPNEQKISEEARKLHEIILENGAYPEQIQSAINSVAEPLRREIEELKSSASFWNDRICLNHTDKERGEFNTCPICLYHIHKQACKERDQLRNRLAQVEAVLKDIRCNCDHEWEEVDASFNHEFGTQIDIYGECVKCGAKTPVSHHKSKPKRDDE